MERRAFLRGAALAAAGGLLAACDNDNDGYDSYDDSDDFDIKRGTKSGGSGSGRSTTGRSSGGGSGRSSSTRR